MIAAVDVHYSGDAGYAACLAFPRWTDAEPDAEYGALVRPVQDYEPGQFWRRELPCLLAVLACLLQPPEVVIIDGYVWLDASDRKGLGAHLFEALGAAIPVVGVAKGSFCGSPHATQVSRGSSSRPLFVTAAGMPLADAAAAVASMHGAHRMPTLLRRVDQLCRQSGPGTSVR